MNPYPPPDARLSGQHNHRHHHQHHQYHQHTRYAQVSSSTRPLSDLPSVSDNSNSYSSQTLLHHHHQRHYQQSRHNPLPYHSSSELQRPITFPLPQYELGTRGPKPAEDDRDRRSIYHHHQHQHHHHALIDNNRRVLVGHNPQVVENRVESQDRRQSIGDNLVRMTYSSADLNLDRHRRPLEHRALSPYVLVDSSGRDTQPISRGRVREDFDSDQQDDPLQGSFRSLAGSYGSQSHQNDKGSYSRFSWVHNNEPSRVLGGSSTEITDYIGIEGMDSGTASFKPEYRDIEFGRCNGVNWGNREVAQEHSLTPLKQLQKKSAFLRLERPRFNSWGRDSERHHSSNYRSDNASGSLSYKGKGPGQFVYSDPAQSDRSEDRSVDLDVSFKSNTLIARPIVPPSTSRTFLGNDYMPLRKKLKSAIVSDSDRTRLSLDKVNESIEKLVTSPSRINAVGHTSCNSKQLHEKVVPSDAEHRGNLEHFDRVIIESDAVVKSESNSLPVSNVNNVSSATGEVEKVNLARAVDNPGVDIQSHKEAVPERQDLKADAKKDVASDEAGKSLGLLQGKNAGKGLPRKAPSIKDTVPESQDSSAGLKENVASDKCSKSIGSGYVKTAGKGFPGKSYTVKDAAPEGRDSSAGLKRVVVADKDGKNAGTDLGKAAHKRLPSKAHTIKDAVFEGGDSNVGSKKDVVSDKDGKNVGLGQGKNAYKRLPGKENLVKDVVPERRDSNAGPKMDVVCNKDDTDIGSRQGKTAEKGMSGTLHAVKDAVAESKASNLGPKRDFIPNKDGKYVASSQDEVADKELPGQVYSVGKDFNADSERGVVSDEDVKHNGSVQGNTADQGLPGKAGAVKDVIPGAQDSNTRRDVDSAKHHRTNVGLAQGETADRGLPSKVHSVKVVAPKDPESNDGAKRDEVRDKDCKTDGSNQAKTADKVLSDKSFLVKVGKKKIVRKVVKKVITRRQETPKQQVSAKHNEPMKAGTPAASASCKNSGSLKEPIVFCGVAASPHTGVPHDSNEAGVLQKIDQVNGASHFNLSLGCLRNSDKCTDVLHDEKDGDSSSSLCRIMSKETKADANDDFDGLRIASCSVQYITVPLAQADDEISMDKFSGKIHQDLKCLPVENQARKDHFADDIHDKPSSHLYVGNDHEDCAVLDGSSRREEASFDPEEHLDVWQDLPAVSGKDNIDATDNKPRDYQISTVISEAHQSTTETGVCLVFDNSSFNSEENIIGLNNFTCSDVSKSFQVGILGKLNKDGKGNPENLVLEVVDTMGCADSASGRCNDEISQVNLVNSTEADICLKLVDVTCSVPSHIVDPVLSFKDPDPAADSSSRGLTMELPVISCGYSGSHGRGSADAAQPSDTNFSVKDGSLVGEGRISPAPRKRRKVCSPCPRSSDTTTPQVDDVGFLADRTRSTSRDIYVRKEEEVPGPSSNALQVAASVSTQEESGVLLSNTGQVRDFNVAGSARNDQLPGAHASSSLGQSVTVNGKSLDELLVEGLPENVPAASFVLDHQYAIIDQERFGDKKPDVHPSDKQAVGNIESSDLFAPEISFQIPHQKLSLSNVENDASLNLKVASPSMLPYVSFSDDIGEVYASPSNDEVTVSVPDALSGGGSPESLNIVLGTETTSGAALLSHLADKGVIKDNRDCEKYLGGRGFSVSDSALTSVSHDNLVDYSLDHAAETSCAERIKTLNFPSGASKTIKSSQNPSSREPFARMNQQNHVIQRSFPGQSSFPATYSKITSSSSTSKANTWRRTNNPSSASQGHKPSMSSLTAKRPFPGKNEKLLNTSYVRKGNSLVRKPDVAASQTQPSLGRVPGYGLHSSCTHDLKKSIPSGNANVNSMENQPSAGGRNISLARPHTPLQASNEIFLNKNNPAPTTFQSSQAASPPIAVSGNLVSDPRGSTANDELKLAEDVTMNFDFPLDNRVSDLGIQNEMAGESLMTSNSKQITYVKHKSNQLVATVSDSDLPIHTVDKTQGLPFKGYYKRKRNQLIRTNANMDEQQGTELIGSSTFGSTKSHKVAAKLRTPVNSASVWTLRSTSGNFSAAHCERIFPWKRVSNWRNFMRNSAHIGDSRSLSAIRRLRLLRKRETVYVRSSHGLSLHKAKVVSVGGCSLKWSKSIERQSKKASEEATRAVAAAEKERRERKFSSVSKSKRRLLRERTFRIGKVRYKMDASRKTLIRISDDESSSLASSQQGKDAKKSYVPRRLVIGNDEYVRIGNGNQLIRDPKKRTRVLANEKVKWSLFTARLKLAKRRKYCQFFTRFGKCNKGDGKCPYIHDPSKIAVCTKFLSGSCSNEDCKLTHEVIPERMPDCSYFLQGLCTNRNCPYRHVNVNPNSSTCEGFLRGYCADGNECRKKHSYVCPIFGSTGNCPLGSKCKLHHPKSRTKGKKRKRSKEKKNAVGRYFGGLTYARVASDPATSAMEKFPTGSNTANGIENPCDGEFADYISLDVTGEDGEYAEGNDHIITDEAIEEQLDMELDDVNDLIKPIRLMNVMA